MDETNSPFHNNGESMVLSIDTTIEPPWYLKSPSDTVSQIAHLSDTSAAALLLLIDAKDIGILAITKHNHFFINDDISYEEG